MGRRAAPSSQCQALLRGAVAPELRGRAVPQRIHGGLVAASSEVQPQTTACASRPSGCAGARGWRQCRPPMLSAAARSHAAVRQSPAGAAHRPGWRVAAVAARQHVAMHGTYRPFQGAGAARYCASSQRPAPGSAPRAPGARRRARWPAPCPCAASRASVTRTWFSLMPTPAPPPPRG